MGDTYLVASGVVATATWAIVVALVWLHLPGNMRWRIAPFFVLPPITTFLASLRFGVEPAIAFVMVAGFGLLLLASCAGRPELIVDQDYIYGEDDVPPGLADRSTRSQWTFLIAFLGIAAVTSAVFWREI